MNKRILATLSLISVCTMFPAYAGDDLNKTEVRAAAFFPMSRHFRQIYGREGLSLQVEGARAWSSHPNLEIWGNLEWIYMHGKPHGGCGSTHINIGNISLGIKGIGSVFRDIIYLYAGIGPDLGMAFIKNRITCCTDCQRTHQSKSALGIGGILKGGLQVYFTDHFYLTGFADYLYLPIHMGGTKDIGGLKAGGGIGARF